MSQKSQNINYDAAKLHFLKGITALERHNFKEAESEFTNSLELLPLRVSTLTNLSAAQLKLGKYSDARSNATLAVEIEPSNWEGWLNIGLASLPSYSYTEFSGFSVEQGGHFK